MNDPTAPPGSRTDTVFALSSGALPAAIAIVRISGPNARRAFSILGCSSPPPRRPALRRLVDPDDGGLLDEALCLFFPSPGSATGEDLVELHCHGSRAVVARLFALLSRGEAMREAAAGEFTRRAFANGRIDLNQADGLAELIEAEDERSRRLAAAMYGGAFSARLDAWRERLLMLSAAVESHLDFSDEDDVGEEDAARLSDAIGALAGDIGPLLDAPLAERIGGGVRVLIAGPPNSGKSTLLNALAGREAAIVSDIAGTTRDLIEVPVRMGGQAFLLTDSAGLRDATEDAIEAEGIGRALRALEVSDVLLWLGPQGEGPAHERRVEIAAKRDADGFAPKGAGALTLSARTGEGMDALREELVARARDILHVEDDYALNRRQHRLVGELHNALVEARAAADPLIVAELLRQARQSVDRLTGQAATEDMLDALFGRFCIGK